jgi:hypothetical protein
LLTCVHTAARKGHATNCFIERSWLHVADDANVTLQLSPALKDALPRNYIPAHPWHRSHLLCDTQTTAAECR